MPRFDDPELREIAIVDSRRPHGSERPPRLVGRVCHLDVITTIGSEVLGPQRRNTRLEVAGRGAQDLRLPAGHRFARLAVPDAWVGLAIDALPTDGRRDIVVLTAIRTTDGNDVSHAATPDFVLEEGDLIVVLGESDAIRRLRNGPLQDD